MRIRAWLPAVGLSVAVLTSACRCRSSDLDVATAVWPEATRKPPTIERLHDVVYKFYPRWYPGTQPLDSYLLAYNHAPEIVALRTQVARVLGNDEKWRDFLDDLRDRLPSYEVLDSSTRTLDMPSFQLSIDLPGKASGTKEIIFRLSHLAPVYDYHEADRAAGTPDTERRSPLAMHYVPSSEADPVVDVVERAITMHFGYHPIDPEMARTPILDVSVGVLRPGEATLTDALFDPTRRL